MPNVKSVKSDVRVDGRRLETLSFAPSTPGRPTLVMLHEGLGSIKLWKQFPQSIATRTGFGVLVYSRYGHGGSDRLEECRPVEYMHHEAEVVLPILLKELEIERPVLLGHSDGGSIALLYAGKHPESASGLILAAPHVFVEELSVKSIEKSRTLYESTDLRSRLARYHQDADATFWGWNNIWLDPRFRSWNIESCMDSIGCPVLVIQGHNDEYGTIRQIEAIQKRIPAAQIAMLPECGHSPHRDQPEATLGLIVKFLADLR
jgi:pimeloyl-ACP methyl ester carboxylesterase